MSIPVFVPLITNAYTLYCNVETGALTPRLPGLEYECLAGLPFIDSNGKLSAEAASLKWAVGLNSEEVEAGARFIPEWYRLRQCLQSVRAELNELAVYVPQPKYYPSSEFCMGRFGSSAWVEPVYLNRFLAPLSVVDIAEYRGLRHPEFMETEAYGRYKHLLIVIIFDEDDSNWSGYSRRLVLTKESYDVALKDGWLSKYTVHSAACLRHGCYVELPESLHAVARLEKDLVRNSVYSLICEFLPAYFASHLKQKIALSNRLQYPDSRYFSPLSVGVS